ncbi:hypothetical protein PHMEG_00035115 [Phytophthora megakarya]|uniref:ABC transporter n=1 Tax=Phytophthora megakarya TaxID=4795 RepID=A0A225UPY8_9STRA|nr:hypothetical protein PHMEG_00035115 [Phytophthora megakarya]
MLLINLHYQLAAVFWKGFQSFGTHGRHSLNTSIAARNKRILAAQALAKRKKTKKQEVATGGAELPLSWETYSTTFLCTHAMPYDQKSSGKRKHSVVRKTECSARINVRVKLRPSGSDYHLVVKVVGGHDHPLTPHQWYNYSENRRIQDPELRHQVATMSKAGAKPKCILSYLRNKTGKNSFGKKLVYFLWY